MIMSSTPGSGMWTAGKVVALNPAQNSIDVLTPDGIRRTIINNGQWLKPAGAGFGGPVAPEQATRPAVAKPAQTRADANVPEWERRKGLGAPPSGSYVCHKISGSADITLGNLDISGNSYRGIESSGGMSPFTVSGGDQITWSAGLDGLPKGWALVSSKYIGSDEHWRPLIRIYYRAATRGALECIDCYKP